MEWQYNFDTESLRRGWNLQQRKCVYSLEFESDIMVVEAFVEGLDGVENEVVLELWTDKGSRLGVDNYCTCMSNENCEHAAAAMFDFIDAYQSYLTMAGQVDPQQEDSWLSAVAAASQVPDTAADNPKKQGRQLLVYVLKMDPDAHYPVSVRFYVVCRLKKGGWGKPKPAVQDFSLLIQKDYVSADDRRLLADLFVLLPTTDFRKVPMNSAAAVAWIERAIDSGRCCWMDAWENRILSRGENRSAELGWRVATSGSQMPSLIVAGETEGTVLPLEVPCYVDQEAMQFGRLKLDVPMRVVREWLQGGPVEPQDVPAMTDAINRIIPEQIAVRPPVEIRTRVVNTEPVPCLTLHTSEPSDWLPHYFQTGAEDDIHALKLEFQYEDVRVEAADKQAIVKIWDDAELVVVNRDFDTEDSTYELIFDYGFKEVGRACHWISGDDPIADWLTLPEDREFLRFMSNKVPELERQGWIVKYDPSFDLNLIEPESWYVDLEERSGGTNWFDAEIGVVVNGESENLLPLLLQFIQETSPQALSKRLEEDVVLRLADGKSINIDAERMRTLAATLLELYGKQPLSKEKKLGIPWIRAMELLRLDQLPDWESRLPNVLNQNLENFKHLSEPPQVKQPEGLRAELRPYQSHGLNWLQFLRGMNLGAVLADDMGLGKTIQALAHILVEKDAGRMNSPCLIVAPTSVLYNWEEEIRRFAPDLKVHVSHGPERKEFFDSFHENNIIVTSYPLLVRDAKCFTDSVFHLAILDEAQFVRNHKTQVARIARLLNASQRIALTGTPLENNLDELWSLFTFAVPGLLGENSLFRKMFRTPIEKNGHKEARRLLAQRITPFILRRTKDEVVKELPRKTEIVQRIDLLPEQKDLYETVRISVEKKVRKSIEEKGVARSHIVFLDALLKMRQVCCHPQLLKLKAAEKIVQSAKLETLREMLVEMVAEGRRILLFSQFVGMIKLIEEMMVAEKIDYVKITGQTRDRQNPIKKFQNGESPVFIISLKAGGTGLNLTAADIVIHYDPWWNPAVENQATDRAHRIGQDKPVFVYKLIAAGTVEEKIVALQQKKSELVNGLLDDQKESLNKWDEADIESFFAPLEENLP